MSDRQDLKLVLNAGLPLVVIETTDESRCLDMLAEIAVASPAAGYRPLYRWSITDGLQRLDLALEPQRHNSEPRDVLGHIRSVTTPGIFVLLDFHPFLSDPVNVRLVKDIAIRAAQSGTVIVFISHALDLPVELKPFSARFDLELPDADARRHILDGIIDAYRSEKHEPRIDSHALALLVRNLSGLSHSDTERLARNAVFDDGAVDAADIPAVMRAKYELLNAGGVLGYEYETTTLADVAGFANLKRWLEQRRAAFGPGRPPELDPPKGILLLGVQGCGKSVAAKATAGVFGVPLLRLDVGTLYNKYHGETERNLRESLQAAEVMSPCVLWVDELEKGFAPGGDGDSGTAQRVLATLLTWMAERRPGVLLVATANDIESLPPELIRKGRFDEIFFVDLPGPRQRAAILAIHLRKRRLAPESMDLTRLVIASDGFSGAEIEQGIVSALYAAHAAGEPPGSVHILAEFERTRPLSVLMHEKISALRQWAAARTVSAD